MVQFVVPLVITAGVFGWLGGEPIMVKEATGSVPMWLQNAGYIWVPFIVASAFAAWFGMNDIASAKASFAEQAVIFERKHNWIMCWLYTGTFGSFIGYSAGFPLLAKTQFPEVNALAYAFLGPLVGALSRSLTGWMSDKYGGGRVTFWVFVGMAIGVVGVLYFLGVGSWPGFFAMFLFLFFVSGVGNASTFQMIPAIMRKEMDRLMPTADAATRARQGGKESAAIIGFTSAIAAYGAFFIPKSYGTSISMTGGPQAALWGFFVFYLTCIAITWWFYTRRGGLLRDIERGSATAPPARLPLNPPNRGHQMSHFLDRLTFFKRIEDDFSDGHGITTNEDRRWEDGYRKRWQHDKIVRSTHGANCTGSCSWKIYVKGGIVTWETQQTDYPRTRPDLPNHEPRGCSRGASYSWYLYSGNRVKYPLVRSRLLKLWREARALRTPVAAWASIVENPEKRAAYTKKRGLGGFVRATWDEVTEIIAAANAYTVKTYGPDRVIGFSPIPAMSMVSYAAGSRYLSLLGGVCMSFYDWYCDLPPASPQTWGEQTDVPESADWYNSGFLIIWGSNVPADAHAGRPFLHRGSLQGRQERRHLPGLFGGLQVRRPMDLGEAGHRRGPRHGHGPRHPARVPHRPEGQVFRGLRPPVYRHADAGAAGEAGRPAGAGSAAAHLGFRRWLGRDQQSRTGRRSRSTRRPARLSCPKVRSGSVGAKRASGTWRRRPQQVPRPGCACRSTTSRTSLPPSPFPISATVSMTTSPAPTIQASWCATCRPSASR